MAFYEYVASDLARSLTMQYSTSFGTASRLFEARLRPHIYHIYGWVRIADEIVDSQSCPDAARELKQFQRDTLRAIKSGYSANPIIHSFAATAREFKFPKELMERFIASMNMDLHPPDHFTKQQFDQYIDGSAKVVGLMCLHVFVQGNRAEYDHLKQGAESLASAFQKINFLRDFAFDTQVLGRHYFPNVRSKLTETAKQKIIIDIRHDFTHSLPALVQLPNNARLAVTVAARYHYALLDKLAMTPASVIAKERVRIPDWRKAQILASASAQHSLNRTTF